MDLNLLEHRRNKYSQGGQDGIIEYIFGVLKTKNGFFVEFGALDGISFSNCHKLFEEGWSGVFIECDRKNFSKLRRNYKSYPGVVTINKYVRPKGKNSFDNIMETYAPHNTIDLLCIDVDGPDLEIFENIERFLPTVAIIEGGKARTRLTVGCQAVV